MIDHGHPHCHIHEVEMMDHVKRSIAASYTSLLSRIDSHIEDNRVHVSAEEKDTWNNKADKTQIRDLEMRLTEKADYCDVIELKEIIAKIKAKVENTSNSDSSDNDDYITESELERALSELRELINNIHVEDPDLTGYATEEWVTTKLGGYALLTKFNDYYTKDQINNMLSNIQPQQPDLSGYIKNTDVLFTFNGRNIKKNDSITVSTDSTQPTVTGLTADDITFVQNPNVPTSGDSSYKIGDLQITGKSPIAIYGKDAVGQGGGTGTNGGHYEIAFKAYEAGTSIAQVRSTMPQNGVAGLTNNWSHSAENSDGSKDVWMINRWISGNDVPNEWQGPWLISGANGDNGIDGDKIEYIYTRSTESDLSNILVNALQTTSQQDDYVPEGWHDNPQGVSIDYPYEWMAFRTKTFSKENPDGTWSAFVGPIVWSHYGHNGTDGDGIEYIFCAKPDGQTYTSDPSTWPVSQEREYIANNEWTDDPVDIENLLQGARQWVSIRKKYADVEGEEPVWHAYSAPTLWSYFAKDGAVQAVLPAVQYSIQVTGSTVAVSYGEEDNTISGTITYRIMRSEGSNISLVGSSNEYNVTTAVMLGGDTTCPDIIYSDGIYTVDIHNRYEGYENYTEIIAYENNSPVATTIVPTIIPGQKGDPGDPGNPGEVQALNLEVIRMRNWVNGATPAYNNGTVIEDGVKYLDIVEHGGNYYKCIIAGTSDIPGAPENVANPGWTILTGMGNAWFDTMIANNAYIKSITTKQIVVTSDAYLDNNGNVVEGNQVVAGMLNGNIIPTSMSGATNGNGIRIFAGTVPANGNIAECAFTVDSNGKVRAGSGSIIFNADGSGQLANGNVTWDANGNVIIRGMLQVGSKVMEIVDGVTGNVISVNRAGNGITVNVTVTNSNDYAVQVSGACSVDSTNNVWSATCVLPTITLLAGQNYTYPITIAREDIPNYDSSISESDTSVTINAWHYVDI